MNKTSTDILIVGGGPAGLSAALSASERSGKDICIIDENPYFGGQIWRAELGKVNSASAKRIIDRISSKNVRHIAGAAVFSAPSDKTLLAETSDGVIQISYDKLIICTGALERYLPFPGWTLPNVFGAGGLQALAKGGLPVKDKRIVIGGSGALLLSVAAYLREKGAKILFIAEQTPASVLANFVLNTLSFPNKAYDAVKLKRALFGIPYRQNSFILRAEGSEQLERVVINKNGKQETIECDYLGCGYNLVPNTRLAQMLGCTIFDGSVLIKDVCRTSLPDVFAAGEITGVGGVDLSIAEGTIAGLTAIEADESEINEHLPKLYKAQRFAGLLETAFELDSRLKDLPKDDTIFCRCEDVTFAQMKEHKNWRSAKLQTRCGMGPCQGQICGIAAEFIFDWHVSGVRSPIVPVKMKSWAEDIAQDIDNVSNNDHE